MTETHPAAWPGALEGMFRAGLAGSVLLTLGLGRDSQYGAWAYAAALLAVGLGLSVALRPGLLARVGFASAAADAALVGLIVADTGGSGSPFFVLYFAAALGLMRPAAEAGKGGYAAGIAASVLLAGGYLLAAVLPGGQEGPLLPGVAFGAGLLAVFCAAALRLGFGIRAARDRAARLSQALAAEREHAGRADARAGALGPALAALPIEAALGLAAEAARVAAGASYSHVASLRGNLHRTVALGDPDACPSWWHPSVQRLLLWSCREGRTVSNGEKVHGLEGFMAVPVGASRDEAWGAIVVGGGSFGAREEHALLELSSAVSPALKRPPDAMGGVDLSSGLPNLASLFRVLRQGEPADGTPSVLAVEVRADPRSDQEDLVRRAAERFRRNGQRVFRYEVDTLLALVYGEAEAAVAARARVLGEVVAAETGAVGNVAADPAVGFAVGQEAGTAAAEPAALVSAALRALEDSKAGMGEGAPVGQWNPPARLDPDLPAVRGLARAAAAHDAYLAGHALGVSRVAARIGRALSLPAEQIDVLTVGGLLHDVGKIGVSEGILRKPGPLDEKEYAAVKRHPAIGAEIVAEAPELAAAIPAILHHHERFDGTGYPDGLDGQDIPLAARIVAVADAFDSMVRERPYKRRLTAKSALVEIQRNAGAQFDPRIAKALSWALREPDGPREDLAM